MKCEICGGSSKCPETWFKEVATLPKEYLEHCHKTTGKGVWCSIGCPEQTSTRCSGHTSYVLPETVVIDGRMYTITTCGTTQAGRIEAHFAAKRTWVGCCSYAFAVIE